MVARRVACRYRDVQPNVAKVRRPWSTEASSARSTSTPHPRWSSRSSAAPSTSGSGGRTRRQLEPAPGADGRASSSADRDRRRRTSCRSRSSTPSRRAVLVPLGLPGGRGRAAGQLAAGDLRARPRGRRHAAADDRDRVPREGLGGRRARGAVPRPRPGLGPTSCPASASTSPRLVSAPMTRRRRRRPLVGDRGPDPAADARPAAGRRRRHGDQLSEQLPVTRQAVAKHLGVLDRVGLVHVTPAGRERRYQVDDAQLARAVAQLAASARPGTPGCGASSGSPRRSSATRTTRSNDRQRRRRTRWSTSCTGSASRIVAGRGLRRADHASTACRLVDRPTPRATPTSAA